MDAQVRAGIDLYGTALRYAEVEQYGERHRLLRLGSCDFDFDVAEALLETGTPEELQTITEALQDVFGGSAARELRVVVHPPRIHSFFAPAPAEENDADREERFRREATLLAQGESAQQVAPASGPPPSIFEKAEPGAAASPAEETLFGDGLHLATDRLYAETRVAGEGEAEEVEWFHVLALPDAAQERFEDVLQALPQPSFRWTVGMQGAAQAALAWLHRQEGPPTEDVDASHTLVVGSYETHLELALCRDGRWHFALHAPTGAAPDSAYYAAALLDQFGLKPGAVEQIFLYGQATDPAAFSVLGRLFGSAPERLNFMPVVDLEAGSLASDFEMGVYVPCVGAAL